MTNPSIKIRNRDILSTEEVDKMLNDAGKLPREMYRLRARALIAILKKFGKRRGEVVSLLRSNVRPVGEDLQFQFTILKKHKKGLFQYLAKTKKQIEDGKADPNILNKPLAEIESDCRVWQETEEGHKLKSESALHSLSLSDKFAQPILDYMTWLDKHAPNAKYLFPSSKEIFGEKIILYNGRHLNGRQVLRIIKEVNPSAWCHLFRETKGAEIAKRLGRSLTAIAEVRDSLDLEEESTAYRYVRRYASKKHALEV